MMSPEKVALAGKGAVFAQGRILAGLVDTPRVPSSSLVPGEASLQALLEPSWEASLGWLLQDWGVSVEGSWGT